MSYRIEKSTGDLVISGWETGISSSPHKGIANLQAVNTSTENGEVMCSYARTQQSQVITTGTLLRTATDKLLDTSTLNLIKVGSWITISGSTISGLADGTYYVLNSTASRTYQLSSSFSQSSGSILTGFGSGTANFTTVFNMGSPVAYTVESYNDTSNLPQYRYYVLDSSGRVWVHDTFTLATVSTPLWFLPYTTTSFTVYGAYTLNLATATGIAVLNGWLMVFAGNTIVCKPTVLLSNAWTGFISGNMTSPLNSSNVHQALVGHQGKLYYTDGNFIGSIFPNSSLLSGLSNIQSYAAWTAPTSGDNTLGTASNLISGSLPTTSTPPSGTTPRVPAFFFSSTTNPTALTAGTVYWIFFDLANQDFQVFAAQTGGSALDLVTGAAGTQYFNTFYPIPASGGISISGGAAAITFTPQRLNLPVFETSQSLIELGNIVLIGCKGNIVYPWDQVAPLPSDLIALPENNAVNMITVNNMAYIFAGYKGNIYITNGSTASVAVSVPDYVAGIAGTQASYIEPYFTWGGAMYLRGRVYFSILDQTAAKAGNCGGVWSFTPTQNMYIGQDTGIALKIENQSSYGSYNGVSTLLIPSQTQNAISPQYWNAWYSSITSPLYGIDYTSTTPSTSAVIETDLIPTGTFFDKTTFKQIEYKLSAPLVNGETVVISYRQNSTDSYVSCGTLVTEGTTGTSGYYNANFEKGQWLQLQITLTPLASTSSSFVRLKEIRVR